MTKPRTYKEAYIALLQKYEKLKVKRKRQFSQAHVIFADALVAFVYGTNFMLSLNDKIPISDIAVSIITIYGAFATGGYFTLQAVRDCSKNKNGITIDENGKATKIE